VDRETSTVIVAESDAETTYPLWRDVLRGGRPVDRPDDPPGTLHLAAQRSDGRVVGVVRFSPNPCPYRSEAQVPWQLRGMATDPGDRGAGVGRALVDEGLARVSAHGGDLVWCDARTTAAGFYERMGFTVVTEPFDKPGIGPHVGMVIDLRPAGGSRSG
jgi:predicted GNAT family N-acyltransferase